MRKSEKNKDNLMLLREEFNLLNEVYRDHDVSSAYVLLKIAGTCNLNCSYCYVFNGQDTRHLLRPKVMDRSVAQATVDRIFGYAQRNGIHDIVLSLHGGEPLLVGKKYFTWLLEYIKDKSPAGLKVDLALQTNGVLLDKEWLKLFERFNISIGISIDGPPDIHDSYRVDHGGRGSYDSVRKAIDLLKEQDSVRWGVLCVINPKIQGLEIYRHFKEIGIKTMDFLLPDYNHDTIPSDLVHTTSLADYLIEIFDEWYNTGDPSIRIRTFQSIMNLLVGGYSQVDSIGGGLIDTIVVETDGSLEPLDVLRSCGDGFTYLNLNVLHNDIEELIATPLFQIGLEPEKHYSDVCRRCPLFRICGAGYLPHRFSQESGFANTNVHCTDLEKLILHIAERIAPDILKTG